MKKTSKRGDVNTLGGDEKEFVEKEFKHISLRKNLYAVEDFLKTSHWRCFGVLAHRCSLTAFWGFGPVRKPHDQAPDARPRTSMRDCAVLEDIQWAVSYTDGNCFS